MIALGDIILDKKHGKKKEKNKILKFLELNGACFGFCVI